MTYISWSSNFALYLEEFSLPSDFTLYLHVLTLYFMIIGPYDLKFDLRINVGQLPKFHGPVILPYVLKLFVV